MIFAARLDSVLFRAMIDALSAFLPEARLHLSEDGLHVIAVDTANVAMVVMHLPREAFINYPMRIEGDYERVHLKYLLAPRIENE